MDKRLKELLKRDGVSYASLADAVGVSPATVSNWANGNRDIYSHHAVSISDFFKVDLRWFCTGEEVSNYLSQPRGKFKALTDNDVYSILKDFDILKKYGKSKYEKLKDDLERIASVVYCEYGESEDA